MKGSDQSNASVLAGMYEYRVQVMVGVDVRADTEDEAISAAIEKVREITNEDPLAAHPKPSWVTGYIACYQQAERNNQ